MAARRKELQLLKAVREGDGAAITRLIGQGVDATCKDRVRLCVRRSEGHHFVTNRTVGELTNRLPL